MANQNFRVKNGLEVGTGATLSSTGTLTVTNLTVTGITTLNVLSSVSATGAASTQNVRTDSLNVSGVSTFAGITTVTGSTLFVKQANVSGIITATSFVKSGATSTNFLKANGDDSPLLSSDVTGALGYTPANAGSITGEYPIGNSIILDNFSSSFNGSTTDFTLATVGTAFTPTGTSANLLVSLGGIIQKPGTDYSIVQVGGENTNTIRFTTAPSSGLDCFVVGLGGQGALLSDVSWNAKGDLVVATGNNVASILSVGSNNNILIADSSAPSGVKWGSSIGSLTFTESATVGTSVTITPSGVNVSGVITATSFVGSGASLTGIVALGSGVQVRANGSIVGTAATIDFGSNLNVSTLSSGIVTITTPGGESYWASTSVGINTLSSVGIGTTNPSNTLTVVGGGTSTSQLFVTGVSTFNSGINVSGVATFSGDTLFATQLNVSGVSTVGLLNVGTSGTILTTTSDGLVGIGTTNPKVAAHIVSAASTALLVDGNARITGILTIGSSSITIDGSSNTLTVPNLVVTNGTTGVVASGVGITIKSNGAELGSAQVIDFTGDLAPSFSAGIATITATGSNFVSTSSGIHTLSSVGVGTTNVNAAVSSSNTAVLSAGIVTAYKYYGDGSNLTGTTLWASTSAGINTLSSVGIGTTDPGSYKLHVNGGIGATTLNLTGNATVGGELIVQGNFTVNGTQSYLNTTSLQVTDKTVGIASTSPRLTDLQLDGAGIVIYGSQGDKTLTWNNTNSRLAFSTDVYSPRYYGDGGNLTFKLNSTGSTSRSIISKQGDIVSVKDFGAVGDGSTDDTSAFQSALNASQNVYVPPGEYLITSTLSIPDRNTSIFGAGMGISKVVAGPSFTDSLFQVAGGGYFTSHDRVFSAKDLSVLTKSGGSSTANGTAFNLKWPSKPTATGSEYYPASDDSSANLQYRRKIRARFESVTVAQYTEGTSASPSNQGWANGIIFENCSYAMVTNCSLTGHGTGSSSGSTAQKAFLNAISSSTADVGEYPAASESACTVSQNAIIWKGTQSCVELWITNCVIHRWNYGVVVQGQAEGVYINNGSFVVCGTGVYWSTDNRKPNLFINATHMSVFNGAVVTSNVEEIFISNCLFYIHQQANSAISLIDLTHTINAKIVNNVLRSRSNYNHIAIALKSNSSPGTQYVLISGNTIGGGAEGAIDSLSGDSFTPGSGDARFYRIISCEGSGLFTNIKIRDNHYIGYITGFADLSSSASGNVSFDGVDGVLVSNDDATANAGAFSINNESETVITWNEKARETGKSEPQTGGLSYPPGNVGGFPAQWFNTSVSSSRIYIPFGVTRVKLTAQVAWQANGSGYRKIYFKKNSNANFTGNSIVTYVPVQNSGTAPPAPSGFSASHETFMTISTPIIPVSGGDYFELYVWQNCGSSLSLNKRNWKTWISVEKVG